MTFSTGIDTGLVLASAVLVTSSIKMGFLEITHELGKVTELIQPADFGQAQVAWELHILLLLSAIAT